MLDQSNYEHIEIEKRRDGVAILTLNRPDKLNAVNSRLHYELATVFREAQSDSEVRAAVITGAGRAFSAGGDFSPDSEFKPLSGLSLMQEGRQIVEDLLAMEKPLICGLNGHAIGLGATIALLCDVVYAARGAKIGDPHVKMGLVAGDGGAMIWPLLAGLSRAKYYLLTGDLMTAEEALAAGLVFEVVDDAEALPRAVALAERLAAGPSYAIQSTKASVNQFLRSAANSVLPLSLALEESSLASADHREAVAAFQERREPRFVDRTHEA